jgi:hypothetical protein
MDYWLEIWLQTYSYLAENLSDRIYLLCYETLCDSSERVWGELAELLQINDHSGTLTFSASSHQGNWSLDEALFDDASNLYEKLKHRSVGYA